MKSPQALIVQSYLHVDYSTGLRSFSSHIHTADNLLPYYLITFHNFAFPVSYSRKKWQLVNSEISHLSFSFLDKEEGNQHAQSYLSYTYLIYNVQKRGKKIPWGLSQRHRNKPLVQVKQEQVFSVIITIHLPACFFLFLPFISFTFYLLHIPPPTILI